MSVIIAILLSTLGVLSFSDSSFSPFIFMALVSAAVGLLLTLLTRKVPLSPINNLINSMNRLKSGDFKARLEFDGKLRNHPIALELKDSFNTMAQELENTEKLRNNFINNFSHEFKTPIVSIAGFAKLLRRGNLSKDQQEEYLKIIEDESLRLSSMATKVLSLSKIENQQRPRFRHPSGGSLCGVSGASSAAVADGAGECGRRAAEGRRSAAMAAD
ncbi:MAG: HAMP domain-containing histidine kinase, partial [Oscillospiraceae bacterium]|nr:HAMP domain-containing histidine kinase [Oscillospiraceae bacterium]